MTHAATTRPTLMILPSVLYTRDLPGGGYVAIESMPADEGHFRAQVAVERRTDPERRAGHPVPIVAEAAGESRSDVFDQLYSIASDNVAVAKAILRWQAQRGGRARG